MDVLSWSRHLRSFPGQGDLPVDRFVRAVLASGYSGPLSLEVFNDHFRSAPSRMIARDGLRSLILAEADAGGAELPRIPEVDGIEFLEFAVDPPAREALAALLVQLGFHLAGRHRSKDVELYRQGGINFVLNSELDSAASEHFQHARPLRLRHGAARRGPGWRARARPRPADPGLARAGRRRGGGDRGGARARWHADLSGRARLARISGRRISSCRQTARTGPGCAGSIIWRSRCPPGRWTPTCCSGARCSASRRSRCSICRTRSG